MGPLSPQPNTLNDEGRAQLRHQESEREGDHSRPEHGDGRKPEHDAPEYIYRKKQLREIDKRLRFLSKRLDDVQIVDPATQPRRNRVFFGDTVTVEDEDGEAATYRIVGVDETDGAAGDISWKSPVGRALLGKGDTVTARWHAGLRELTIAKIVYR